MEQVKNDELYEGEFFLIIGELWFLAMVWRINGKHQQYFMNDMTGGMK